MISLVLWIFLFCFFLLLLLCFNYRDYILCSTMFENGGVFCIVEAEMNPMLTHFELLFVISPAALLRTCWLHSFQLLCCFYTAGKTKVSPLKKNMKKGSWTVQLSFLILKLLENICKLSASPTTDCNALFAKRPFSPSLLHVFILLLNSKISPTRANILHNFLLPPVIRLPYHFLLCKHLIFPGCSALSQTVLKSAPPS